MERDSKNTIIAVLGVLLVIVAALWIWEMNKPAGIEEFKQAITEKQAKVDAACADTTTDDKREACMDALKELRSVLEALD